MQERFPSVEEALAETHKLEFPVIIKPYRKCLFKKEGDEVEYFDNDLKCLGIVFMKFENQEEMEDMLSSINEHIEIRLIEPLTVIRGGKYYHMISGKIAEYLTMEVAA
ncbi:hypothetical protein [Desulfosporosinus nitroreducens]|uniref:Uncharacterized protein n=1 Tax=Desulfosporosinus nitroreducens TaxID=2018668 RepID=A0ABT8QSG4_9FIRM|nr:hypothetical protein [Desulfosporosinus nitroreducens]MDO0824291.1 hypothetical protein [Desulfosporosinus nitroreducens]